MAFNSRLVALVLPALIVSLPTLVLAQTVPSQDAVAVEFFEKKIRPLLADNCFNCHSTNTNSQGGLRVDDRNGLTVGGNRGAAIVPGDPEKSLLIKAVRQTDKLKMPPMKQLSEQQIADLTTWIQDGAVWPKVEFTLPKGDPSPEYARLRKKHWAWQPLRDVKAPVVRAADWARDDIDRFIQASLEGKELSPVSDADKVTLIRRVTFDLTGLPPTLEEIAAFVKDVGHVSNVPDEHVENVLHETKAIEKVVDRLLASAAFGERWGRHWLDVARYGESTGSARNLPYPHAWRYRDYVIDAFNNDKPYDQFIREQIAGDLLPANSEAQRDEQLIATGFLALGVKDVNQRYKVRFVMDNVDEQIDTVSRAVLGLTASCARCHDHKFDPIPQTDYYALAGIFRSTDLCAGVRNKMGGGGLDYYDTDLLLKLGPAKSSENDSATKREETKKALAEARAELQTLADSKEGNELAPDGRQKNVVAREKVAKLQAELLAYSDPAMQGSVAYGVRDSKTISDTEIRVRGEAEKLGPVVARGFLGVIPFADPPQVNPNQSGRLELAQWLTSEKNPLTSRVMANRIWQHLFGQGLVLSVDNFGATGDAPSHPELLDHLAQRFVRDGWSVKKLVRAIVLTRAYQLGSATPSTHMATDPANELVWRHSPRRLDAEEIRDATLAAAGTLSLSRPEASLAKDFKVTELRNNGPEAQRLMAGAVSNTQRSVYLPLVRNITPTSLDVFDFATQGMVTGSRDTTTVATQALYLLNDPFVRRQSLAFADRLLKQADRDDAARVDLAYQWAMGRAATTAEIERTTNYLTEYATAAREVQTPKLAQAGRKAPKRAAAKTSNAQTAAIINPDQVPRDEDQVKDEVIEPTDPQHAAWVSFCQALLGSADFRSVR